jgi:hypothetical protein
LCFLSLVFLLLLAGSLRSEVFEELAVVFVKAQGELLHGQFEFFSHDFVDVAPDGAGLFNAVVACQRDGVVLRRDLILFLTVWVFLFRLLG